jgi:hypothetical protein
MTDDKFERLYNDIEEIVVADARLENTLAAANTLLRRLVDDKNIWDTDLENEILAFLDSQSQSFLDSQSQSEGGKCT